MDALKENMKDIHATEDIEDRKWRREKEKKKLINAVKQNNVDNIYVLMQQKGAEGRVSWKLLSTGATCNKQQNQE